MRWLFLDIHIILHPFVRKYEFYINVLLLYEFPISQLHFIYCKHLDSACVHDRHHSRDDDNFQRNIRNNHSKLNNESLSGDRPIDQSKNKPLERKEQKWRDQNTLWVQQKADNIQRPLQKRLYLSIYLPKLYESITMSLLHLVWQQNVFIFLLCLNSHPSVSMLHELWILNTRK